MKESIEATMQQIQATLDDRKKRRSALRSRSGNSRASTSHSLLRPGSRVSVTSRSARSRESRTAHVERLSQARKKRNATTKENATKSRVSFARSSAKQENSNDKKQQIKAEDTKLKPKDATTGATDGLSQPIESRSADPDHEEAEHIPQRGNTKEDRPGDVIRVPTENDDVSATQQSTFVTQADDVTTSDAEVLLAHEKTSSEIGRRQESGLYIDTSRVRERKTDSRPVTRASSRYSSHSDPRNAAELSDDEQP